jgi:hypothetical protein
MYKICSNVKHKIFSKKRFPTNSRYNFSVVVKYYNGYDLGTSTNKTEGWQESKIYYLAM